MTDVTFYECRFDDNAGEGEAGRWGVPRDWREDLFGAALEALGLDYHGHVCEDDGRMAPFVARGVPWYEIDTPLFALRPYRWDDLDEGRGLPNFEFKPWGFEMSWYKYPCRDAWSNCLLTDDEWRRMCGAVSAFDGGGWPPVQEDFKPTEADVVAAEWRERLARAVAKHDALWEAAAGLVEALEEGGTVDEALAAVKKAVGYDEMKALEDALADGSGDDPARVGQ